MLPLSLTTTLSPATGPAHREVLQAALITRIYFPGYRERFAPHKTGGARLRPSRLLWRRMPGAQSRWAR